MYLQSTVSSGGGQSWGWSLYMHPTSELAYVIHAITGASEVELNITVRRGSGWVQVNPSPTQERIGGSNPAFLLALSLLQVERSCRPAFGKGRSLFEDGLRGPLLLVGRVAMLPKDSLDEPPQIGAHVLA